MFIVSADSHIDSTWLPANLFTNNASAALRERMPYVADSPEGPRWVSRDGPGFGLATGVGSAGKTYIKGASYRADRMAEAGLYSDASRAALRLCNPRMRIEDQDTDGVSAEVLYGMLGASIRLGDTEASWEMARIYNDWLVDFCAHAPNRLLGLASIPTHSPELAAAEIVRVARRGGIRGIDASGGEARARPLFHADWDVFWRAIEESGLPVHFHTLGPNLRDLRGFSTLDVHRSKAEGLANCQYERASLVLRETILGGVLEAHPNIKLVLSESGIGWIPYMLERMDQNWDDQYRPLLNLRHKPSEYWRRQCYATYQTELFGSKVIDFVGEDNVMWASDFPHPDGLWPDSQSMIAAQYQDTPETTRRKVLSENAVKLYGLDASSVSALTRRAA